MGKVVVRSIYSNSDRNRSFLLCFIFHFAVYISCDNKSEISNTAAPLIFEEAKEEPRLSPAFRAWLISPALLTHCQDCVSSIAKIVSHPLPRYVLSITVSAAFIICESWDEFLGSIVV